MKLRIKGNSIRFRLTQSEVNRLASEGLVRESVSFSESTFGYEIHSDSEIDAITADLERMLIVVSVPTNRIRGWAGSESISIEHDGSPSILIEKDFACLTVRPGEDDLDAFPNPRQEC